MTWSNRRAEEQFRGHSAVSIDTSIVGGTLLDWEAFPQRTKKRAGNAVKRVIAS
jgi:hypothetical protein